MKVYTSTDPWPKKVPAWAKDVLKDENGEIFVPAVLADSEMYVFFCASHDGEPVAQHKGHMFVRLSWMEREYVKTRTACKNIRESVGRADTEVVA